MSEAPTLRARAVFTWSKPGEPPRRFEARLYSTDIVQLDAEPPYATLVVGDVPWEANENAIRSTGGYSDPSLRPEDREHLLLKATNALRKGLGLPLHDATPRYPGTE